MKKQLLKKELKRKRKTSNRYRYWAAAGILFVLLLGGLYIYRTNLSEAHQKQFRRAEKLIEKKQYRRAVSQLRSLYQHYPNTETAPRALLLAGDILLLNLQQEQESLLSFLLLERDYPDTQWCPTARRRVAEIYKYHLQDYDRALVAYQKLLENKSPDKAAIQYEIADTYFRMNNFEQTRIEFEILLNDYPESPLLPEALYRIGSAFFLEGNLKEAVPVLRKLCHDYPDHSFSMEAYYLLAQVHEERGELRKALGILEGLKGRYSKDSLLAQRIAQIRQRIERKTQAI